MILEAAELVAVPTRARGRADDAMEPRVLPGAAAGWPAASRWTFDFLRRCFADSPVVLSDDVGAPSKHLKVRFAAYADYCLGDTLALPPPPGASPWYLGNWDIFADAPELADDFTLPEGVEDHMPGWGSDPRWHFGRFGWLFVGPAGTRSFPHRDLFATHAWIAQLQGTKRVRLAAYEQVAAANKAGRDRTVDWAWEAELKAGDVLLIPAMMLHEAESNEPSISLSFNYVDDRNEVLVRQAVAADPDRWARKIAGAGVVWPA